MGEPRPIVVRVSVGDLAHLIKCAVWAAQQGSWDAFRRCLWVERENRRQGTWRPFTIGDMIVLRRCRRYHVTWPPRGPRPFWRHGTAWPHPELDIPARRPR